METGNKRRDEELLNDIFNEHDLQLIKSIHIPTQNRKDSWVWELKKVGFLFKVVIE